MANLQLVGTYKLRSYCYQGNQVGINTRYVFIGAITGAPVTEDAFLLALDAILSALYKPLLANTAVYEGMDMQNITTGPPYPIQTTSTSFSGAGTGGALPAPGQVSGIYSTFTNQTGRSYRGRSYIPFPPAALSSTAAPPVPTAGYIALAQSLANAVTGSQTITISGTTILFSWVILHQAPAGIRGTLSGIVLNEVRTAWATQRRRGDYGRPNPVPL
jgi:hypothetical protein